MIFIEMSQSSSSPKIESQLKLSASSSSSSTLEQISFCHPTISSNNLNISHLDDEEIVLFDNDSSSIDNPTKKTQNMTPLNGQQTCHEDDEEKTGFHHQQTKPLLLSSSRHHESLATTTKPLPNSSSSSSQAVTLSSASSNNTIVDDLSGQSSSPLSKNKKDDSGTLLSRIPDLIESPILNKGLSPRLQRMLKSNKNKLKHEYHDNESKMETNLFDSNYDDEDESGDKTSPSAGSSSQQVSSVIASSVQKISAIDSSNESSFFVGSPRAMAILKAASSANSEKNSSLLMSSSPVTKNNSKYVPTNPAFSSSSSSSHSSSSDSNSDDSDSGSGSSSRRKSHRPKTLERSASFQSTPLWSNNSTMTTTNSNSPMLTSSPYTRGSACLKAIKNKLLSKSPNLSPNSVKKAIVCETFKTNSPSTQQSSSKTLTSILKISSSSSSIKKKKVNFKEPVVSKSFHFDSSVAFLEESSTLNASIWSLKRKELVFENESPSNKSDGENFTSDNDENEVFEIPLKKSKFENVTNNSNRKKSYIEKNSECISEIEQAIRQELKSKDYTSEFIVEMASKEKDEQLKNLENEKTENLLNEDPQHSENKKQFSAISHSSVNRNDYNQSKRSNQKQSTENGDNSDDSVECVFESIHEKQLEQNSVILDPLINLVQYVDSPPSQSSKKDLVLEKVDDFDLMVTEVENAANDSDFESVPIVQMPESSETSQTNSSSIKLAEISVEDDDSSCDDQFKKNLGFKPSTEFLEQTETKKILKNKINNCLGIENSNKNIEPIEQPFQIEHFLSNNEDKNLVVLESPEKKSSSQDSIYEQEPMDIDEFSLSSPQSTNIEDPCLIVIDESPQKPVLSDEVTKSKTDRHNIKQNLFLQDEPLDFSKASSTATTTSLSTTISVVNLLQRKFTPRKSILRQPTNSDLNRKKRVVFSEPVVSREVLFDKTFSNLENRRNKLCHQKAATFDYDDGSGGNHDIKTVLFDNDNKKQHSLPTSWLLNNDNDDDNREELSFSMSYDEGFRLEDIINSSQSFQKDEFKEPKTNQPSATSDKLTTEKPSIEKVESHSSELLKRSNSFEINSNDTNCSTSSSSLGSFEKYMVFTQKFEEQPLTLSKELVELSNNTVEQKSSVNEEENSLNNSQSKFFTNPCSSTNENSDDQNCMVMVPMPLGLAKQFHHYLTQFLKQHEK